MGCSDHRWTSTRGRLATIRHELRHVPSYAKLAERLLGFQRRDLGVGVPDQEIVVLEAKLTVRIEGGYRKFVRQFGHGGVEGFELFGLGGPAYLDLARITESERSEMEPRLAAYLLPIMNDGFGNLLCLDTRVRGEPSVVFWDHEAGRDQVAEVEAVNFTSWLWALLDECDE